MTSAEGELPEVNVPFTVKAEVPENVSSFGIVTVMPEGIITTSDEIEDPGAVPPHVAPELKFPEATAV